MSYGNYRHKKNRKGLWIALVLILVGVLLISYGISNGGLLFGGLNIMLSGYISFFLGVLILGIYLKNWFQRTTGLNF